MASGMSRRELHPIVRRKCMVYCSSRARMHVPVEISDQDKKSSCCTPLSELREGHNGLPCCVPRMRWRGIRNLGSTSEDKV